MPMHTFKIYHLIIILFIQNLIKGGNPDEYEYYFQLYSNSTQNRENPNLFYSQTNDKLLVINSTEEENCSIIDRRKTNEYSYKDLSSITLMDKDYLVKTCLGPNKLLEVQIKNKETFTFKKNNFQSIKFCYSTKIINPSFSVQYPDIYVIITY